MSRQVVPGVVLAVEPGKVFLLAQPKRNEDYVVLTPDVADRLASWLETSAEVARKPAESPEVDRG